MVSNHYICYRTPHPLEIDGTLTDSAWDLAPWTNYFQDIEGAKKNTPRYSSRVKLLWDDTYLYVGGSFEEPQVWAKLAEKNSIVFYDNDFEVFIDPDGDNHNYYEFEINALNTIWELVLAKPYRDGGPVFYGKNLAGLKSAVHISGVLNDPTVTSKGWSVEIAFPWQELIQFHRSGLKPKHGDQWRVNFSRVEWQNEVINGVFQRKPDLPEDNWVWSPQGVIDMHRPETWGFLQFSDAAPGTDVFVADGYWERKSGYQSDLAGESGRTAQGDDMIPAVSYFSSLSGEKTTRQNSAALMHQQAIDDLNYRVHRQFSDANLAEDLPVESRSGFKQLLLFCQEQKIKTIIFLNAKRFNGFDSYQELAYRDLSNHGFEVILFFSH